MYSVCEGLPNRRLEIKEFMPAMLKKFKGKASLFLAALLFAETAVSGICYGQEAEAFSNAEETVVFAEAFEEESAEITADALLGTEEPQEAISEIEDASDEERFVFESNEMIAAVATEGTAEDMILLGNGGETAEDLCETAEIGFEIDEETGFITTNFIAEALPKKKQGMDSIRLLGAPEASYDGRQFFTAAKDQKGHNTCWSFSTIALAEASMIKKGKAQKASVDYSELGLAYFMYNDETIVDPLGLTAGDHAELTGKTYVSVGGNPLFSMMALSGWKGIQKEEDLPYTKIGQTGFTSADCYENNAAILKNSVVYNLQANASYVKEAIKTYGGATIEMHAGSRLDYVKDDKGRYCFWNDTKADADHSVVIVGWDDNFPKENFGLSGSYSNIVRKTPEKNGAWLVRNSWSADFGDDGYSWLSYEDKSLGANATAMEFMPADSYDNNYHYDGTGGNATCTYTGQDGKTYCYLAEGGSVGNIYRVSDNSAQQLTAVSVGFATVNTGYSIQIYTNSAKMKNPMDGTPALKAPITGKSGAAGVYLIEIPATEDVYLTKGEYFSVVVTATSSPYDSKIVQMYTDKNLKSSDESLLFVNHTEENQSYIKSNCNSNWVDMRKSSNEAMRSWTFRLKALTKNVETRPITPTAFELEEAVVEVGRSEEVSFKVTPANATWDKITCTVGDTNYATAAVDENGCVVVKGLKIGTTDMTCTMSWGDKSLTANATVRVVYRPDDMYFSSETKEVKKGSTATLAPTFFLELENGKKTTDVYVDDYTFEWSSDDTSIVTVTPVGNGKTAKITAKAVGEAWISVTCVDNRILGADICVSVTTSGGEGGENTALWLETNTEIMHGGKGCKVNVDVMISDPSGHAGGLMTVCWPEETFRLVNVADGKFFNESMSEIDDLENIHGSITLLFDGTLEKSNKTGEGKLAVLTLECIEGAEIGEKEISLSEVTLFDALKPLGEGEDEVTDLTGTSINVLEMLYGDLLFDGKISISDLAVIRRYLAGWADSTDVGTWPEADINKDDDVNMDDVAILQRYLARWEGYEKFFQ